MKITYYTPLDWWGEKEAKKVTPKGYDYEVVKLDEPLNKLQISNGFNWRFTCFIKGWNKDCHPHYVGDYNTWKGSYRGQSSRWAGSKINYTRSFVKKNGYVYFKKNDDVAKWCSKSKKGAIPQWIYTPQHENLHIKSRDLDKEDKLHEWIGLGKYDKYESEYLFEKKTIKFHKATHKIFGTWNLTQMFGANDLPLYKELGLRGHNGLDFASPVGWKMYFNVETPNDITWTCYNYEDKYGKKIVSISDEKVPLKTGDEYIGVIHLHIKESKVVDGQKIKFGDYFAITGNTGLSTGPHTHEALKITDKNGRAKNKDNGYNGAIEHYEYYL